MLGFENKKQKISRLERENRELQECLININQLLKLQLGIKNRNKIINNDIFNNNEYEIKVRESMKEDLKAKDEQCFELTQEIKELREKLNKKGGEENDN